MNILNFKKQTAVDLASIVIQVKEYDTKIKQLEHKRDKLIETLDEARDANFEIHDMNGEYLGIKKPGSQNRFSQKLLNMDYPHLVEKYRVETITKGTWRFI